MKQKRPEIVALIVGVMLVFVYAEYGLQNIFAGALGYVQSRSPLAAAIIESGTAHVAAADLAGVALVSFASRLFFLPLPSEPYIAYAYGSGAGSILPILVALFGTLGSVVNYYAGILLRRFVMKDKKAEKMAERLQRSRLVIPTIFAAALLPLPDVLGLVFGAVRVGIRRFIVFTFAGLLMKALVIVVAYDAVKPYLMALF